MPFVYHFHENKVKFVERNSLSLDEETLKLPTGLYTTFKTLQNGTKAIGLSLHFSRLALREGEEHLLRGTLREVINENNRQGSEWKVRLYRQESQSLDWWIMLEEFHPVTIEARLNGVRVNLSQVDREKPTEKSTAFIRKSLAERAANQQSRVYESLIVANGLIREGFTSNFFYFRNGELGTAKQNILHGVTRATVLRLARELSIPVNYRALRVAELDSVSEAFICSSSRGIIPISELITDRFVQWGRGGITTALQDRYHAQESASSEPI